MTTISESVIGFVRAKAEANPEFVYKHPIEQSIAGGAGIAKSCLYVHAGCPSCLIGHALWDAGYVGNSLEGTGDNHVEVAELLHKLGIYHEFSRDEIVWLAQVQQQQDKGMPWGEAVAYADFHSSFNN